MRRAWACAKEPPLHSSRRYLVLAPDAFLDTAKTAHGVIRYGSDETVAVVDPSLSGKTVREVLPHLGSDAPIVSSVAEGLRYEPTALLIGTAPKGGRLPPDWRAAILVAIRAGLEIVSGLHDLIADDPQFAREAQTNGVHIWDVRKPPEVPLFSGAVYGVQAPVLLAVGNDCNVGKMTVMLELAGAAEAAGTRAEFVPTGQTGIMIAGWGIAIDRVIADFAPGAAEQLVLEAQDRGAQAILVEGQGAINHPAYAPVTLALLYGSAPDALLLVVDPGRRAIDGYPTPTMAYKELIAMHEALCATVKPARVAGVALNTRRLDDDAARRAIEWAREETGLPADDLVRFGAESFWSAIAPALRKTQPLGAVPA